MRYYVSVGERIVEVVIDGASVTVDGKAVGPTLERVRGTPMHYLNVDGKSHRVIASPGEEKGVWDVHVDGRHVSAEVVDERTRAIRAMTNRAGAAQGPRPVRAPMPGMVVRVEVAVGDVVKAGQGVVIIEAMKMENELRAEASGKVSRITANPGTAVEKGALLIEFESADA